MLFVKICKVGHEVLDDRLVRQWINRDIAGTKLVHRLGAGEGICAINIEGARSANPFAAGAPESKAWVDFIFDLDQCIQNHGDAGHFDLI